MAELNISVEFTTQLDGFFLISDEVTQLIQLIMYIGVCQSINIFGVVTNIINIMCFIKQGFKDPVNISLLGLSISDLGAMATLLLINANFMAAVIALAELPYEAIEVNYLVIFMPHLAFNRITSWITAIITVERCLCIVAPLKVKSIVTHKRMTVIIVSTFVVLLLSGAPVYFVNKLGLRFSPEKNRTIIGLVCFEGREIVEAISFAVNNFSIPSTAFLITVICTVILVVKLKGTNQWRKTTGQVASSITSRNRKVATMVVMISGLFIACFIPLSVVMLAVAFQPQIAMGGKYLNIGIVLGGLMYILESVNSSVNIFIYFYMSSKYKATFKIIFCKEHDERKFTKYM